MRVLFCRSWSGKSVDPGVESRVDTKVWTVCRHRWLTYIGEVRVLGGCLLSVYSASVNTTAMGSSLK